MLDCSTILAGPMVCQILGDFGADVIKVEHPERPDGLRRRGRETAALGLRHFPLIVVPLRLVGATGSPVRPLALLPSESTAA